MKNESKGQVQKSRFGKITADLFREMETGHPPDQEVASFVRIRKEEQTQFGIVIDVKSEVPPLSEVPRGVSIAPNQTAEEKMYVDVYNPLADYSADVVIIAKREGNKIIPGPKLTVTLPYSIIEPVSSEETTALLKLGYFFLYHLIDEVQNRMLLSLISLLPERLKDNPEFNLWDYLATVVDVLASMNIDLARKDIREQLERLAQQGIGLTYKMKRMNIEIITFPSAELKLGDIVAIRDYKSKMVNIAIIMGIIDGIVEAQVELQRRMDSTKLELASIQVHRGSLVDKNVKQELIELSRPMGPSNAIRIEIGRIYGTDLLYELELVPGRNCHCSLAAISEGGKSNTVKVIGYQIIKNKLPMGMLIYDEHGEYSRSGEDYAFDVLDSKTYILADPFTDPESRIPLHWIHIIRFLEGSKSAPARPAFRRILQLYYRGPGTSDPDKPKYPDRLTVNALNWILQQGTAKALRHELKTDEKDHLSGYGNSTLDIVIRELRNISHMTDVIQIEYDPATDSFRDLYTSTGDHLLKKVFMAQKQAKVMVLDVSGITSSHVKMWLKRLVLDSVVEQRRARYRKNRAKFDKQYKFFIFVFEEATAAFDEETMAKIREYREFAVGARKFFCGYMPVMQDPTTLDPVLLSQLMNAIILKIPQENLRKDMFRRLPSDATPFDGFIEKATPGQSIIVNPVKKGLGNLPVPVQIHYLNELVDSDLKKALEEHKGDIEKVVKQTRLAKEFVELQVSTLVGDDESYEEKY